MKKQKAKRKKEEPNKRAKTYKKEEVKKKQAHKPTTLTSTGQFIPLKNRRLRNIERGSRESSWGRRQMRGRRRRNVGTLVLHFYHPHHLRKKRKKWQFAFYFGIFFVCFVCLFDRTRERASEREEKVRGVGIKW
jgi:hypothetical protein